MGGGPVARSSPLAITRSLSKNWRFTQIGGGNGTKDGEWLNVSSVPTTVHVELLKLQRIPDPVCAIFP